VTVVQKKDLAQELADFPVIVIALVFSHGQFHG
jgi:hypothetical protein